MYCNLTDEQKEAIRTQILLKHPFERVVFQKTGPVMGLNVGAGALGLAFYDAEVPDYRIGSMLTPDYIEDVKEEAAPEEGMEETFIPDKKWYENIEGINGAMAIENSGSEEVFRTVLKIFYESLDNKLSEINEMYNAEDFENYTIKVHALKSSAKLVGAQKLSEDALALEMAGKEGNTAYIKENHEAMVEELTEFQEKLSEFFEGDDSVYDEGEILDDLEPKVLVSKESDGNYDAFLIESILETLEDGIKNKNRELISNTVRDAAEYSLPPELEDKLRKIKMLLEEEKENYDEMQSVLADS